MASKPGIMSGQASAISAVSRQRAGPPGVWTTARSRPGMAGRPSGVRHASPSGSQCMPQRSPEGGSSGSSSSSGSRVRAGARPRRRMAAAMAPTRPSARACSRARWRWRARRSLRSAAGRATRARLSSTRDWNSGSARRSWRVAVRRPARRAARGTEQSSARYSAAISSWRGVGGSGEEGGAGRHRKRIAGEQQLQGHKPSTDMAPELSSEAVTEVYRQRNSRRQRSCGVQWTA